MINGWFKKRWLKIVSKGLLLLFLLSLAVVHPGFSPSTATAHTPELHWDFRSIPLNGLKDVAWGNDTYVAVGEDGSILSSPDGDSWTRISGLPEGIHGITFNGIAWGDPGFVAVGENGRAIFSPDGAVWTVHSTPTLRDYHDVAWCNNMFIAVGNGGTIITSWNGTGWSNQTFGSNTKANLFGIYWSSFIGTNTFVASGADGTILTSSNGENWTVQDTPVEEDLHSINQRVYTTMPDFQFHLQLVAVGNNGTIISSGDFGQTWYEQSSGTTRNLSDIERYGGKFYAVGSGGDILSSTNGISWTTQSVASNHLRGMTGRSGTLTVVGDSSTVFMSLDGDNWQLKNPAEYVSKFADLSGVTWGNDQFIAVGTSTFSMMGQPSLPYSYFRTSGDGQAWDGRITLDLGLNNVVWSGQRYVAVGDSGTVITSLDGESWTSQSSGTSNDLYGITTRGIRPIPSIRLIAVGAQAAILTSDDHGDSWVTREDSGIIDFHGVTRFNSTLFAVGDDGIILSSTWGESWSLVHNVPIILDLYAAASSSDLMVAVGKNGSIITSTDGEWWTSRNSGTSRHLYGVTWVPGSNIFVAVGESGTILTSHNGINWKANISGTENHLRDVVSGGGEIIAVGDKNTILGASDVRVTGVNLDWSELVMEAGGDTETLTAKVEPADATNKNVTWESSDEAVATVHNGVVTPLKAGTTTITARTIDGGHTDTCHVTVVDVSRIFGNNRYTTAAAVSQEGWPGGAETVVLARGDDYADALAGVPLAYYLNAPILLTRTDRTVAATMDEINRLEAERVILLGGTGAISQAVEDELAGLGLTVERIAGNNRYQTAALIAERLKDAGSDFDTAFIAVGTSFADALAASSYAAMRGEPILLTPTNRLHGATEGALKNLGITKTFVCGGVGAIDDTVFGLLPEPERFAGSNRYETGTVLAEAFLPAETKHVIIATGLDFPDAISGGVLAAKMNTGVLLVRGDRTAPNLVVQAFLSHKEINSVTLLGGLGVISGEIESWFWNELGR